MCLLAFGSILHRSLIAGSAQLKILFHISGEPFRVVPEQCQSVIRDAPVLRDLRQDTERLGRQDPFSTLPLLPSYLWNM